MSIPSTLTTYLAAGCCRFASARSVAAEEAPLLQRAGSAQLPPERLVRTELYSNGRGLLALVLPAAAELDLAALAAHGGRPRPAGHATTREAFPNCDPRALSPLSEAYGVPALVDPAIDAWDRVCFSAGHPDWFITLSGGDFRRITADARRIPLGRAPPVAEPEPPSRLDRRHLERHIKALRGLPPLPPLAAELLHQGGNPYFEPHHLARLVQREPAVALRVLAYAQRRAPTTRLDNLEQAVIRVLGRAFAQDLALALALRGALAVPERGPLGRERQQARALRVAELAYRLCRALPRSRQPPPGPAFVAAMLHDLGLALLAHRFPRAFARLSGAVAMAGAATAELEERVLGVALPELGAWLLDGWRLPAELRDAVAHQRDADYQGPHAVYAGLVGLAQRLRDGACAETPEVVSLSNRLGLAPAVIAAVTGGAQR